MRKLINLVISVISGIMWRLGGAEGFSKGFRRYGVSGILGIMAFLKTKKWYIGFLSMGMAFGAFTLGYGESSFIGEFWYNIVDSHLMWDICVRATVGLLYGLAYLPTILCIKKYKYLYTILLPVVLCPAIRLLGNTVGAVWEEWIIGFSLMFIYCFLVPSKID